MTYTLALRLRAPALAHPQRLLLRVEGERIADVEYRPDVGGGSPFSQSRYTVDALVTTGAALCPYCSVAHSLALCQAIEAVAEVQVPPRAATLRTLAAELERVASHLATVGELFVALGRTDAAQLMKEQHDAARNALKLLAGSPPGCWIVPGGVASDPGAVDLAPYVEMAASALDRLFKLTDRLVGARGLLARTVEVGILSPSAAQQMALSGPLARASGLRIDVRHDAPYAAYTSLRPELITQEGGDVYARMLVLILEALESLKLIERAAADPPGGPAQSVLPTQLPDGVGGSSVEAPRGALRYQVESVEGELRLLSCRVAPQLDQLLARMMLIGNTLDSAALIALSTDPCGMCLKLTQ